MWVDNYLRDKVTISKHGQTLVINYIGSKGDYNNGYSTGIIITCPFVASIATNPYISPQSAGNRSILKNGGTMVITDYLFGVTRIGGFNQPEMSVNANRFTEIDLEKNIIGELTADVDAGKAGDAALTVNNDNQIKIANLQAEGRGRLSLVDLHIDKINYHLADSAQVILTCKALHLLGQ